MDKINLLLDSARGQFIPRDFVTEFDLSKFLGVSQWAVAQCKDPENDHYWDAWNDILSNVKYRTDDGREFFLYQDGDVWLLCFDEMTDEEKQNFGFFD